MSDFIGDEQHMTQYDAAAEQVVQKQEAPQEHQESSKEQNLRYLRERAEAAEKRTQELEFYLQQNMNQNKAATKIELEEDDFDISDDSYIEGHQFKKYVSKLKNEFKKTTQQLQEMSQRSAMDQAELKLKSEFPDINQVVNEENLNKLAKIKPALYRSIMANTDLYDRGYTAYEMIKSAGISGDYNPVDRRFDENKSKPRSSANAGPQAAETPLTRLGDYDRRILTKEQKDQIMRNSKAAQMYR